MFRKLFGHSHKEEPVTPEKKKDDHAREEKLYGSVEQARNHFLATPQRRGRRDGEKSVLEMSVWELARLGDVSRVRKRLIEGADPMEIADAQYNTALHYAAEGGHAEVVGILLRRGAYAHAPNKFGSTPLHWAAGNASPDHVQVIEALCAGGADPNAQTGTGTTPLHMAAENGCVNSIIALIQGGAFVDAVDAYFNTPLHRACENGYLRAAMCLLQHGANARAENKFESLPLGCALNSSCVPATEHENWRHMFESTVEIRENPELELEDMLKPEEEEAAERMRMTAEEREAERKDQIRRKWLITSSEKKIDWASNHSAWRYNK